MSKVLLRDSNDITKPLSVTSADVGKVVGVDEDGNIALIEGGGGESNAIQLEYDEAQGWYIPYDDATVDNMFLEGKLPPVYYDIDDTATLYFYPLYGNHNATEIIFATTSGGGSVITVSFTKSAGLGHYYFSWD